MEIHELSLYATKCSDTGNMSFRYERRWERVELNGTKINLDIALLNRFFLEIDHFQSIKCTNDFQFEMKWLKYSINLEMKYEMSSQQCYK